ncbi:MAG: sulfite exporter TauE/SafE family protein [Cytophagaceae bacterium]|jgi:hypothetical protein|nr:sulfite exporter TauE/SafE family protein [Cytophagaceae bacterium]
MVITSEAYLYLLLALFAVAYLYASVGHGGASGYVAVFSIAGLNAAFIKPHSLLLNILASSIAFYFFIRYARGSTRLLLWLLAGSVPSAYAGSGMPVQDHFYKILLATFLAFSMLWLLVGNYHQAEKPLNNPQGWMLIGTGIVIGFISGILGIGGGILLSPILLLFRWCHTKESASISAAFILLNSCSALAGLRYPLPPLSGQLFSILAVVGIAAIVGAYAGSRRYNTQAFRWILATVLTVAIYKLLFT